MCVFSDDSTSVPFIGVYYLHNKSRAIILSHTLPRLSQSIMHTRTGACPGIESHSSQAFSHPDAHIPAHLHISSSCILIFVEWWAWILTCTPCLMNNFHIWSRRQGNPPSPARIQQACLTNIHSSIIIQILNPFILKHPYFLDYTYMQRQAKMSYKGFRNASN